MCVCARRQCSGVSRREDVDNGIWADPDFAGLSAQAKIVYLWSFTNPRCGMAGIYRVDAARTAAFECSLEADEATAAIEELTTARFLFCAEGVLWVRSRLRYLRTRTEQIAKSVAKDLEQIPPEHPLRLAWLNAYGDQVWLQKHHVLEDVVSDSAVVKQLSLVPDPGPTRDFPNLTRTSPEVPGSRSGLTTGKEV